MTEDSTEPTADEVYETYYPNLVAVARLTPPVTPPAVVNDDLVTYERYYPDETERVPARGTSNRCNGWGTRCCCRSLQSPMPPTSWPSVSGTANAWMGRTRRFTIVVSSLP